MKNTFFNKRLEKWVLKKQKFDSEISGKSLSSVFFSIYLMDRFGLYFPENKIKKYLTDIQKENIINDIYSLYYLCKALEFLKLKILDRKNATAIVLKYIDKETARFFHLSNPLEVVYMSTHIMKFLGYKNFRKIKKIIFKYSQTNGGFGLSRRSDIASTYFAIETLKLIDYPIYKTRDTLEFVLKLENCDYGFMSVLNNYSHFIEDTYYGLKIMGIFKATKIKENVKFILRCQNGDGGFGRRETGGISTFENCFYASNSLDILSRTVRW